MSSAISGSAESSLRNGVGLGMDTCLRHRDRPRMWLDPVRGARFPEYRREARVVGCGLWAGAGTCRALLRRRCGVVGRTEAAAARRLDREARVGGEVEGLDRPELTRFAGG